MSWRLLFSHRAQKDAALVGEAGLKPKVMALLGVLENNPFANPPAYEKLMGVLGGAYSRRINLQHRLLYQVLKQRKSVKVIRMWTHYQ